MKRLSAAAFLIVLAAATCARGDTLVSGSVYNRDLSGNVCTSSGGSAGALSMSCGDVAYPSTDGYASLTASVGDMSGMADAYVTSWEQGAFGFSTYGSADFNLSVDGTYELTGGSGYGYADLDINTLTSGEGGGGYLSCSITLDGQTQNCSPYGGPTSSFGGGDLQFYVPYNTPLNLDLDVSFLGAGFDNDAIDNSGINYSFGDLTPVPEPFSLLLLGTGLIPLVARVRRRR